jgi:hypothetical protein
MMNSMFWGNGREALEAKLQVIAKECIIPVIIGNEKNYKENVTKNLVNKR